MTLQEQLADANRRLDLARQYYTKNQNEIKHLNLVIDEIVGGLVSGEFTRNLQHPAIEEAERAVGEMHRLHTIANKYRQWCRLTLSAAQRPEHSHLLNDTTWEVILSGMEADLENEDKQPPF